MGIGEKRRDRPFMEKPPPGWIHDDGALAHEGLFYSYPLQYLGEIEVSNSLRPLSVDEQTIVTRELIALLVEECGLRARGNRPIPSKLSHYVNGRILAANIPCMLNISADGCLIAPETGGQEGIIGFHKMTGISLAAGGELDDYPIVAYVAKAVGSRKAHVFDCGDLSDDVLATMGQAFTLAKNRMTVKQLPDGTYDHANFTANGGTYMDVAMVDGVSNPSYLEIGEGQQRAGAGADGTYLDVAPPGQRAAGGGGGTYLDVAPPGSRPGGGGAATYLDVCPPGSRPAGESAYLDVAPPPVAKDSPFLLASTSNPEYFCVRGDNAYNPYDMKGGEDLYGELYGDADCLENNLPYQLYDDIDKFRVVAKLNKVDEVRRAKRKELDPEYNDPVVDPSEKKPTWAYYKNPAAMPTIDPTSLK